MEKISTVLIVDDEPGICELLGAVIEGNFEHVNVVMAQSVKEAIQCLTSNPEISLIISDYDMPNENGAEFFNYVKKNNYNCTFVFFSSHDDTFISSSIEGKADGIVSKTTPIDVVKDQVKKYLVRTGVTDIESNLYCKFRPAQLLKMGILPSDAYVKIHDGKFVRIMYKGDTFETEDFEHYSAKKLSYLYIRKEDFEQLVLKMENDLHRLNKLLTDFQEDIVEIPANAHSIVREFYQKFGINPTIQRVVKETIDLTLKSIRSQPQLSDLFKKIKQKEGQYLSYHSILLAHISCVLANKMEWTSIATVNKLVMAAFLHDITLPDYTLEQILKMENEIKEKRKDILRYPELLRYCEHAQAAADLFDKIDQPIPDVSIILEQHHELPDGNGFPHGLTALTISPLAAVLITAHELIDAYFTEKKNLDLTAYINSLSPSYHRGNFKAVTRVLTDLAIDLKSQLT